MAGEGTLSWGRLDGEVGSVTEEEAWDISIILLTENWELDDEERDGRGAMTDQGVKWEP